MDIKKLCPGCMEETLENGVCEHCGYSSDDVNSNEQLPQKFILKNRYVVGKAIYNTCEGVVYLGLDTVNLCKVEIKEFYPEGIAIRNPDKTVGVIDLSKQAFGDALSDFVSLNNSLLQVELPSLAKTLDVFEENGTAYAVSEMVNGITLKSFVERNGGLLKWEQVRPLFLPLIDTVNQLNGVGIIHGGISPESIFVGRDGRLRLREILISRVRRVDRELSAQIYGGYSAIEQYDIDGAPLGGYTDVYGISATLMRTLMGIVPPGADKRREQETLSIPAHFAEELPRQVLVAMANGLQLLPEKRTQTVEKFRDELVYGETAENMKAAQIKKAQKEDVVSKKPTKAEKKQKEKKEIKTGLIALLCTVGVILVLIAILVFTLGKSYFFGDKDKKTVSSEESMPEISSIGTYDSTVVDAKEEFTVPNLLGLTMAEIEENADGDNYKHFKFVVIEKKFSSSYPRGQVCAQAVAAGTGVDDKTVIPLTISLGTQEFKAANTVGLSELEAKIELLKQGILFQNIEVVAKYDPDKKPGVVLEQTPQSGTTINAESKVRIYVNSYKGDSEEDN